MEIVIETVNISLSSEHLILLGIALWIGLPKMRRLLKLKK